MKENERTLKKNRVYEIYGIPKEERQKYSVHHIVFRSDIKKGNGMWKGFNVDKISNLYPLLKEEHRKLHEKVKRMNN